MRYEILGPLRVVDGDHVLAIGAPKRELVLGLLLVRSNQVVPADDLITEVWGDDPPRRARAALHVSISHLRKFLARPDRAGNPIVTQAGGYLLDLSRDELDAHEFVRLAELGRNHIKQRRFEEAAALMESALGLWRGPTRGDLPSGSAISRYVTWLMELRLGCSEMLADAQLELGFHRELVPSLYSLTAEHPLREVFYRQLMLALYRSDRKADALMVYQTARRTLNAELGLEPCRSVQDLQQTILMADAPAR
ncbi:BTAD domain-containing putative transcriptional regulator [Kitasatospora sp. NPDC058032]|uniref:AfsR/SARP family transcriptional regulator n=1 Tax=Kitasatospora sp. NPDC058032 TaxID=3346307 RepID=UPI0036DAA19F